MPEGFQFSVDDDWKKQAQAEKKKLEEEARSRAAKPSAPSSPRAPSDDPASWAGDDLGTVSGGNTSPASASAGPRRPARRRVRRSAEDLPPADFEGLVQTLAAQALMYLGSVPLASGEAVVDLDTARHQIDLLTVVEAKTRGNLSGDERRLLDVTLYEVRSRFTSVASRYIL